jgi:hypothetical protein
VSEFALIGLTAVATRRREAAAMSFLRRIFNKLFRRKRKPDNDASIYPMF